MTMKNPSKQNLDLFSLPKGFRGRTAFIVQLWWVVQATLFGCSPQFLYGWRRFLLRLFGANIASNVLIRASARITFPWKVSIGASSWIGDDVVIYSLDKVEIGKNVVISQRSYLCTGSHDYRRQDFEIITGAITISDEVWIATDVFIAPAVTVGDKSVVGARSSVFKSLPSNMICYGNPATAVKQRT